MTIVADDPEAMFISALGFGATLRTSGGAEVTFPGKYLQIGDSACDGALMLKMGGGNSLFVTNLTLVGGVMVNGDGGTQTVKSDSTIQVKSSASRPFYFTGGKDRAITVEAGLESDATAVAVVNRYSIGGNVYSEERNNSFTLTLGGNNSGYKGKWIVDNLDKNGATTVEQANGKPIYLSISDASKLGADPDFFVADAVTLKNNGALLVTGDTLALGNRGLTVDSTGGRIVRNGDLTISGSISGTGTLDLTDVNGVLTLNATVADTVTIRRLIKFTNRGDNNASSDYYMNDTDKWTNGEKATPGFGYIVDTRETENTSLRTSGHSGGDSGIVEDFLNMLEGRDSVSATEIHESVESHMMACAAEEARLAAEREAEEVFVGGISRLWYCRDIDRYVISRVTNTEKLYETEIEGEPITYYKYYVAPQIVNSFEQADINILFFFFFLSEIAISIVNDLVVLRYI